jgi:hypothetical protein
MYYSDKLCLIPKTPQPHLLWGKSRRPQSFVPITEKPNSLVIKMWTVVFQVSSEDVSVPLMNFSNGSNPVALTVRSVVTPRTMIYRDDLEQSWSGLSPYSSM